ncbi:pyridoxamine 5'-phosphate oxidase family protein [Chryseolinea lacunae]|uniref:Pyridoxamine 5'-phosphate oxidase family protein n=1 Tax=Chryseolinea lacunae TaxID=2801331 RepID=A0ABS1KYN6_9BACT|nr:pyridoxamine 5'-phosphate oxidase family protein [Chryseolinea lacunae]MBL0744565.1 pyridoxamine 5'-phosphate oxidase family protein [Chryseolinea lacunae]
MTTEDKIHLEDMMPALQGVIPTIVATASADHTPNVTYISQVYFVDADHVALSYQFFNKTIRNVRENPMLTAIVTCPVHYDLYRFILRYEESQTDGEIFDAMEIQLEALATAQNKEGIFKLKAADIYEVVSIEKI